MLEFKDEEKLQERFLQILESKEKAEEIQCLWNNSYPHEGISPLSFKTKLEVFCESAKKRGFSLMQINAFLDLP